MVRDVNKSILILGKKNKICQNEEKQMSKVSRKSITFNKDVKKNMIIKKNDLMLKRPGTGLFYNKIKSIIGKKAKKNFTKNYQPNLRDFY